jgi:hypothetical protein
MSDETIGMVDLGIGTAVLRKKDTTGALQLQITYPMGTPEVAANIVIWGVDEIKRLRDLLNRIP